MSDSKEFMYISALAMEEEFVRQGMSRGDARQQAKKDFAQKLSDLLDEGWEVIAADSVAAHLRKA